MSFELVSGRLHHMPSPEPGRAPNTPHRSAASPAWIPLIVAALLVACGANTGDKGHGSGGEAGTGRAPEAGGSAAAGGGAAGSRSGTKPTAGLVGAFNLRLVPATEASATSNGKPAQTAFIGSASDGPTPLAQSWIVDQEAAGCTLYTPKQPLCSPGCGATAVCVTDDHCVARPKAQDLGKIHLRGVSAHEITMSAIAGNYQPPTGTTLPYPPCGEGDALELTVDGGEYEAFTLGARCIEPLDFQGPIKLVKHAPLALTWNTPGQPDLARIHVHIDISHHGGARGKIECDLPDNGKVEIPAAMVDKLVELGVAGFPTVVVTRVQSGGVQGSDEPQNITFVVQNAVERAIEIDGLVSCTDSAQCPGGQTCQTDSTCK